MLSNRSKSYQANIRTTRLHKTIANLPRPTLVLTHKTWMEISPSNYSQTDIVDDGRDRRKSSMDSADARCMGVEWNHQTFPQLSRNCPISTVWGTIGREDRHCGEFLFWTRKPHVTPTIELLQVRAYSISMFVNLNERRERVLITEEETIRRPKWSMWVSEVSVPSVHMMPSFNQKASLDDEIAIFFVHHLIFIIILPMSSPCHYELDTRPTIGRHGNCWWPNQQSVGFQLPATPSISISTFPTAVRQTTAVTSWDDTFITFLRLQNLSCFKLVIFHKISTTMVTRPHDDRTYCARSAFTHLDLWRNLCDCSMYRFTTNQRVT